MSSVTPDVSTRGAPGVVPRSVVGPWPFGTVGFGTSAATGPFVRPGAAGVAGPVVCFGAVDATGPVVCRGVVESTGPVVGFGVAEGFELAVVMSKDVTMLLWPALRLHDVSAESHMVPDAFFARMWRAMFPVVTVALPGWSNVGVVTSAVALILKGPDEGAVVLVMRNGAGMSSCFRGASTWADASTVPSTVDMPESASHFVTLASAVATAWTVRVLPGRPTTTSSGRAVVIFTVKEWVLTANGVHV